MYLEIMKRQITSVRDDFNSQMAQYDGQKNELKKKIAEMVVAELEDYFAMERGL